MTPYRFDLLLAVDETVLDGRDGSLAPPKDPAQWGITDICTAIRRGVISLPESAIVRCEKSDDAIGI